MFGHYKMKCQLKGWMIVKKYSHSHQRTTSLGMTSSSTRKVWMEYGEYKKEGRRFGSVFGQ